MFRNPLLYEWATSFFAWSPILIIWRFYLENTEKSEPQQNENDHAKENLGITQSSGLDHLSGPPDK